MSGMFYTLATIGVVMLPRRVREAVIRWLVREVMG